MYMETTVCVRVLAEGALGGFASPTKLDMFIVPIFQSPHQTMTMSKR